MPAYSRAAVTEASQADVDTTWPASVLFRSRRVILPGPQLLCERLGGVRKGGREAAWQGSEHSSVRIGWIPPGAPAWRWASSRPDWPRWCAATSWWRWAGSAA